MTYKDHAKEQDTTLQTGIHTRIDDNRRLSSCFRKFANENFEKWGWETFLWNGDRVEKQYDVYESADKVIDLHTRILKNGSGEEET